MPLAARGCDPAAAQKAEPMFRKLRWAAFFAAASLPATAAEIAVLNKSDRTVLEIYLRDPAGTIWTEDILGDSMIPADAVVDVKLPQMGHACKVDMRVVDKDDNETVIPAVEICSIARLRIETADQAGGLKASPD